MSFLPEAPSPGTAPVRGRPSLTRNFAATLSELLARDPSARGSYLLSCLHARGYKGSKSAFYELMRQVRGGGFGASIVQPHLPGAVSRHAWGKTTIDFRDGTWLRTHFLVSWLPYSRAACVTLLEPRIEPGLRALLTHFNRLGGRPLLAVFDDPGPFATAATHTSVTWSPPLIAACLSAEIGLGTLKQNGPGFDVRMNHLARWLKWSLFNRGRFRDSEELDQALRTWTPEDACPIRGQEERSRLRPSNCDADRLRVWFDATVAADGAITVDGLSIGAPPELAQHPVKVGLGTSSLQIVAADRPGRIWRSPRRSPLAWKCADSSATRPALD